jgi:NAD(P)-dependent dehydrogenase (short-subunit alcohol dehydrogenase family)
MFVIAVTDYCYAALAEGTSPRPQPTWAVSSVRTMPPPVRTDMLIQDLKASAERIPVGRFGTPTEVASIVLSLVQNAYVTGQTISVNGGVYMT